MIQYRKNLSVSHTHKYVNEIIKCNRHLYIVHSICPQQFCVKCPQNFMKTYIPTDIFFTVNVTRKISYFFASCLRKIAIKLSSSRRKSRGGRSQRGFAVSRFFLLYFSASQETSFEFLFNTNNITQREINSATTVLHSFIPVNKTIWWFKKKILF